MEQKNIPMYIYEKEQRYGIMLAILLRTWFPHARANKKLFIDTLIDKGFSKETLRKLFVKGQVSQHTRINDQGWVEVTARKKVSNYGRQFARVEKEVLMSIRTLVDMRDFLTTLHACKPMKVFHDQTKNKKVDLQTCQGRRLKKIGQSTGSVYKSTVCRQVKRSQKKYKFSKVNRFQPTINGNRMQIENVYYSAKIDYLFDKKNGFISLKKNFEGFKKDSRICIVEFQISTKIQKVEKFGLRNFEDSYAWERQRFVADPNSKCSLEGMVQKSNPIISLSL